MQPLNETVRLNVGSGPYVLPGWTSIDKSLTPLLERVPLAKGALVLMGLLDYTQLQNVWPAGVVRLDVTKSLPYEAGSVDAIYSSHFVEHLTRDEADRFFREALRVLRPGGILRLAVPDLQLAAREYLTRVDAGDPVAGDAFIESLSVNPTHSGSRLRKLALRLVHRPHGWMYDELSLSHRLESVGFLVIGRRSAADSTCPDAERLDTRPTSLFVDAQSRDHVAV